MPLLQQRKLQKKKHYCPHDGREMKKVTGTKGLYRCKCGYELNTKRKKRLGDDVMFWALGQLVKDT